MPPKTTSEPDELVAACRAKITELYSRQFTTGGDVLAEDLAAFVRSRIEQATAGTVCPRSMHMYVWKTGRFLAVAQSSDQFEARKIVLQEFADEGAPKEFSERVTNTAPEIFHRAVADFARTDSYELEQADAEVEKIKRERAQAVAEARLLIEGWRAESRKLVEKSENCKNIGEDHRSDILFGRGMELDGCAARLERALAEAQR